MSSRYTAPILEPAVRPSGRDYLIRLFVYELSRAATCRGPDPDTAELTDLVARLRALEAKDVDELLVADREGDRKMADEFLERAAKLEIERARLLDAVEAIEGWDLDLNERGEQSVKGGRSAAVRSEICREVDSLAETIFRMREKAGEIRAELETDPGDGERVRSKAIIRIADEICSANRNLARRAVERRAVVEMADEVAASIVRAFPPAPELAACVELFAVGLTKESVGTGAPIEALYDIDRTAATSAARIVVDGVPIKERIPGAFSGWVVLVDGDGARVILEGAPEGRELAETIVACQQSRVRLGRTKEWRDRNGSAQIVQAFAVRAESAR